MKRSAWFLVDPVARMLGLAVLAVLVLAVVFALVWGGLVTR